MGGEGGGTGRRRGRENCSQVVIMYERIETSKKKKKKKKTSLKLKKDKQVGRASH